MTLICLTVRAQQSPIMTGASAQHPQQQQGRAALTPSALSLLAMWQAETWPLGGALTAIFP